MGQSSTSVFTSDCIVSRWFRSRLSDAMRTVLFFALLYLYLWLVVQSCLIYSCGTITDFPIFYKGWPFFHDCMSRPGGLLNYAGAFLSQLFYYSWAGAAVITAQAWALTACTGWLFRILGIPAARWLRFVPALLVLAAYARYSYHLPGIMGTVIALFAACLYVSLVGGGRNAESDRHGTSQLMRAVTFVVLSVIVYAVGAATFLPFAVVCAVYELLYHRRYVMGPVYLLLGVVLPYVLGVLIYGVSIIDAYTDALPLSWRIRGWPMREKMVTAVYVLYLLPLAGVLAGGLWRAIATRKSETTTHQAAIKSALPGQAKAAKGLLSRTRRWLGAPSVKWATGSVALLLVGGAVGFISLDAQEQARLRVHYYACQRMWPDVLQAARRCPADPFVMNAVNRALWHTGRFTQDMFSYPQYREGLLCTCDDRVLVYWNKFDTQIDLGLVSVAEKHLTECMEAFGEQPMILERLATVNMVKGSMDTARIYLGALSKTLFHSRWAKDYLARLETDPNLAGDRRIQDLRARCLKKDNTALFYAKEEMLAALAGQDNRNRMAFEYLMAWYMQTRQIDKFVENISRLREFGYATVPSLYQEALAIYAYPRNKAGEYPISPEVRSRFENFSRIFNKYKRDKAAALGELAAGYRNSYLFYFIYAL